MIVTAPGGADDQRSHQDEASATPQTSYLLDPAAVASAVRRRLGRSARDRAEGQAQVLRGGSRISIRIARCMTSPDSVTSSRILDVSASPRT